MPESEYVNVTEVRRWAKEAGYDVPARGALKQEIYDAYNDRDKSTSDEPPAGHSDAAGIEDEVTATISTNDGAGDGDGDVKTQPADESTSNETEIDTDRYESSWIAATGFNQQSWDNSRVLRNRVSVQTLENGFIHGQRATGTDEVQARLSERGFLNSPAHGVADETTVQAYARFQDSLGLPGTGIPEQTSLEALGFDVLE